MNTDDAHAPLLVARPPEPLLDVSVNGGRALAVLLSDVDRLAEVPASAVESLGGREVVRLESRAIPVIRLGRLLGPVVSTPTTPTPTTPTDPLHLVVVRVGERQFALAVDRVIGISLEHADAHDLLDVAAALDADARLLVTA